MTRHDLQILDTLETAEYMKGELSDDGQPGFVLRSNVNFLTRRLEIDIPPHMVPPNPDDSDSKFSGRHGQSESR